MGDIYARSAEFERYAARMGACSGFLRFGWVNDKETGESRLRLRECQFCRVRNCPVCQWRRTLMWQARFYQALPQITEQYPKARWLFLTLTVKNPPIGELRDTLAHMNKSWQRLIQRKALGDIQGWIRTTEVTKPDDSGYCHPHFHVLLMVKPSYFTRGYIKHSKWVELWQSCLQVGYEPNVDVRTVKAKKLNNGEDADQVIARALKDAVAETLKYSTKPADMVSDEAWFLELTRQTHKLRFMASGGALKDVLKVDQESDEELVMAEGEADGEDDGSRIGFTWRPTSQTYRRSKKLDRGPTGPKQDDGLTGKES